MNKKILITALIILTAASTAGAYFYLSSDTPESSSDTSEKTEEKNESEDNASSVTDKANEIDNETQTDNDDSSVKSDEPESLQKPVISTAEQSGDLVIIRTVINEAKSGTCTLILTKGDKKVTKKAAIGLVTSYYTCQGFDVPTSELGSKGEWTASVRLDSEGKSATSSKVKVEVQ